MNAFQAAKTGNLERVRAVGWAGCGGGARRDGRRQDRVLVCGTWGHVEVARYLLDHGAVLNHHDRLGSTALHGACSDSHTEMVLFLLERSADVTAVDDYGATALLDAVGHGDDSDATVRSLLEHGGSDVDAAEENGVTACHDACSRGRPGVLRQLLSAGADSTLRDLNGRTAGDLAAAQGHHDCVRALQEWDRISFLQKARNLHEA